MEPFPPVRVGDDLIRVDRFRPVAVIRRPGGVDTVVRWPGVETGWAGPIVTVAPAPDGVWVHYGLPAARSLVDPTVAALVDELDAPVVHIRASDGQLTILRIGTRRVLGATRHGLWTTDHVDPSAGDEYGGGPLPDDWHEDTEVTLVSGAGATCSLVVDRSVLAVDEQAGEVRLLVHASPPFPTTTGYSSRPVEVTLPARAPLPATVRFRDHVPSGWGPPADVEPGRIRFPQRSSMPTEPAADAPDADGEWDVVALPVPVREVAVAAVVGQFQSLEHYWRSPGGGPASPLSAGIRDVVVAAIGEHPDTRVAVTFRHPHLPGGRLRRTVRVFDRAGRIVADPHLAIWLMEDLDTGALPPASDARDGVLDV